VVDVQPRAPDEPVHQPGIDQRDDRVVVSGQDERRLAQPRQERQAGPARRGGELVHVAARRADPVTVVHRRHDLRGIDSRQPAVEVAGDPLQVARVQVTPRCRQVHQDRRPGRHHRRTGRGRHEHEPAAPGPLEGGEVLGDAAAPGDAEHVDAIVAELGQHGRDQPAEPAEAVRPARRGRAADARRVEPDHLDGRVELVYERLEQFKAGTDAVDQQQRDALCPVGQARPDRDPQHLASDGDAAYLSGRGHRFRARSGWRPWGYCHAG